MRTTTPQPLALTRRRALAAPAAALVAGALGPALLAACGGGGDSVADASAGALTVGPIGGLGSIIVGGVRFDDSAARVEDDDDGASRSRSELRLGMMVEVESSSIDEALGTAAALLIRFGSEIKGPIASIDAAAQTIRVLDQTVEIRAETVLDPALAGGFAALAVGQILEIHALFDSATGHYLATRIELEDSASEYRLRGRISALDTTARTFRIGDAVISYAGVPATELPVLADGLRVRVRLQTAQVGGRWIATRVRTGTRRVDDFRDVRLRGFVTAFTSSAQFEVNGIPVNASGASFEPSAAAVQLGALVGIVGQAENGVVIARRVKAIDRLGDEWRRVELHGSLSGLDTTAKTFVLREIRVDYSRVVEWEDGRESDLANGKLLEVKGLWSEDRSVLYAVQIEFE